MGSIALVWRAASAQSSATDVQPRARAPSRTRSPAASRLERDLLPGARARVSLLVRRRRRLRRLRRHRPGLDRRRRPADRSRPAARRRGGVPSARRRVGTPRGVLRRGAASGGRAALARPPHRRAAGVGSAGLVRGASRQQRAAGAAPACPREGRHRPDRRPRRAGLEHGAAPPRSRGAGGPVARPARDGPDGFPGPGGSAHPARGAPRAPRRAGRPRRGVPHRGTNLRPPGVAAPEPHPRAGRAQWHHRAAGGPRHARMRARGSRARPRRW